MLGCTIISHDAQRLAFKFVDDAIIQEMDEGEKDALENGQCHGLELAV